MVVFYFNFTKRLGLLLFALVFLSLRLAAQPTSFENHDFKKPDSIAALYPNHPLTDLKHLSDKLTLPFTSEVDKFRAIYKWVCDNIENDYAFYVKNKRKRAKLKDDPEALKEWNRKANPRVFQKLLRERKTVCTGYAYLLKELAFHAGITSEVVDGYGRTPQANIGGEGIQNHSWNAVQLNKEWYLCDATWSSGTNDPQQAKFIKRYNDGYFLAAPSFFVRNHYPLDTSWILLKEKPTLQEFLNRPIVYRDAFSQKILPVFPETFDVEATKGKKLSFLFSSKSDLVMEKIELQITKGSKTISVYPKVFQDADSFYGVDHVFSSTGRYVVHILLNGEYVFTYTIRVLNG